MCSKLNIIYGTDTYILKTYFHCVFYVKVIYISIYNSYKSSFTIKYALKRYNMNDNVQCSLYKIVLQMYVLQLSFDTFTFDTLVSGCILTWTRIMLFCLIIRYIVYNKIQETKLYLRYGRQKLTKYNDE